MIWQPEPIILEAASWQRMPLWKMCSVRALSAYREVYAAGERLCRRLGVQFGDDVDVEAIVDNMMEIQREIGLKMYEYGWYFAKGGDGIHKV